jgi:hypothetical protein
LKPKARSFLHTFLGVLNAAAEVFTTLGGGETHYWVKRNPAFVFLPVKAGIFG